METDDNIIMQMLDELIAGKNIPFKITRGTKCGTPELWQEEISYELGALQCFNSIRSALDEGGQAIGCWQSKADIAILKELLPAIKESQIYTLQNEAISPGEEYVYWQLAIGEPPNENLFTLSYPYDSALKQKLLTIDTLMRRIAYHLSAKKLGYELAVSIDIDRSTTPSRVSMDLINAGNQACKVSNPLANEFSEFSSVSIQVAAPEDPENPTGLGFQYQAIPLKIASSLGSAWSEPFITLESQQTVSVPIVCAVDTSALRGHYIRAVFTAYEGSHSEANDEYQKQLPTISGKVFSIETAI